jgi:hypothetical protein
MTSESTAESEKGWTGPLDRDNSGVAAEDAMRRRLMIMAVSMAIRCHIRGEKRGSISAFARLAVPRTTRML